MRHYYACNPVKNKAFENFAYHRCQGYRSKVGVNRLWLVSLRKWQDFCTLPKLRDMASLMEELKMEQTGLEMIGAQSFITQFGILSGPTDLRSLITDRASSTASEEIMYSSGTSIGV